MISSSALIGTIFPIFMSRFRPLSAARNQRKLFSGSSFSSVKHKPVGYTFDLTCHAIFKSHTQENTILSHNDVLKWLQNGKSKESKLDEIEVRADLIRTMLVSMKDGEITVSAYDTAWVALIENKDGTDGPQFPTSLYWIANNQLSDGSWGDPIKFIVHDRILSTLACVIALKRWNTHPENCKKGLGFIRENIKKLHEDKEEHMPIGFEVTFPSLVEMAQEMSIEVSLEDTILHEIYAKRDLKLGRIPREIMHETPTTLLHSLEGLKGLEWEKLLKLQCSDGSFLFSPSSTAYALIHTRDSKCFSYLANTLQKFNGAVPNVYPVDLFERIWAADRMERLGISRFFESEIKECVDYVYKYWTEGGVCWARNTNVYDLDDTAMGFRILRLHGHHVSADAFRNFEKDEEFVCFPGQSTQAVTGILNLYRACQVAFPGEKILENARNFSYQFLREKQAANELLDKWIILKDLQGEVGYALDVPWYANLPRIGARFYIQQYGGQDDVWIGKTLYRMPFVNNNTYLELAKLDFNRCQAIHRLEWDNIQRWYKKWKIEDEYGVEKRALVEFYFVAAANIFEAKRTSERCAWAKTAILIHIILSYFNHPTTLEDHKWIFVHEFINNTTISGYITPQRCWGKNKEGQKLLKVVLETLNHLSLDALMAYGTNTHYQLCTIWKIWLLSCLNGGEKAGEEAEMIVRTIYLSGGKSLSDDIFSHPNYTALILLTNQICHQLSQFKNHKERGNRNLNRKIMKDEMRNIETSMQKLMEIVLRSYKNDIPRDLKHIFSDIAKSSYYIAYCSRELIDMHISKVLFEPIV